MKSRSYIYTRFDGRKIDTGSKTPVYKVVEQQTIESKAKTEQGFLQLFYHYNRFAQRGEHYSRVIDSPGEFIVYIYKKRSLPFDYNRVIAQFELND